MYMTSGIVIRTKYWKMTTQYCTFSRWRT